MYARLAQGRCPKARRLGVEPASFGALDDMTVVVGPSGSSSSSAVAATAVVVVVVMGMPMIKRQSVVNVVHRGCA